MNLDKENMKKIALLITYTVCLFVGLFHLDVILNLFGFIWGIAFPFIMGAAMAFVLNVPMRFLEEKVMKKLNFSGKRPLSLTVSIVLVLAVLFFAFTVIIPQLIETIQTIAVTFERVIPQIQLKLEELFKMYPEIQQSIASLDLDWKSMVTALADFLKNGATSVVNQTVSFAFSFASAATNFFIAFIFACYILLMKEKLHRQIRYILMAILPKKRFDTVMKVGSLSYRIFSSFVVGQVKEACIFGIMLFACMSLFGMPYAMLISVLVALLALIPIVGPFISCGIGVLLILMVNPMQALVFLILFLVLQQIEGNIIYPRTVGNSVGLPAIWVIFSVTIGGALMGIIGMFICIPISSIIYALVREWTYKRLEEKQLLLANQEVQNEA